MIIANDQVLVGIEGEVAVGVVGVAAGGAALVETGGEVGIAQAIAVAGFGGEEAGAIRVMSSISARSQQVPDQYSQGEDIAAGVVAVLAVEAVVALVGFVVLVFAVVGGGPLFTGSAGEQR